MRKTLVSVSLAGLLGFSTAGHARDYITIVGSSTVYPFATVVAENFGRGTAFKTPKIESTGTGGGFKLFCAGVGVGHPDITNASRRIKQSEIDDCAAHGVTEIVEATIGFDGIVLANSRKAQPMALSARDIFLALAKVVPNPKGGDDLVPNPYRTWKDVNPTLPANRIEVMGPPPTSGTRDAFVELAMEGGCQTFPSIKAVKAQNEDRFKAICHGLREDGAYIEAGENDNLIVQKLEANPRAVGIFGFSFLDQNIDQLHGASVGGVAPTFENIADGSYPVARSLYYYVKKAHIGSVPGIAEYNAEFMSERAIGDEGYLIDKGLIPMPPQQRKQMQTAVTGLKPLRGLDS